MSVNKKAYDRARYLANREKYLAYQKKKLYGLSTEEITALGDSCEICGSKQSNIRYGKQSNLDIDHDHSTGQIRGLLCSSCNLGLGKFKDSIINLNSAIAYLWRYNEFNDTTFGEYSSKDLELRGKTKYVPGS